MFDHVVEKKEWKNYFSDISKKTKGQLIKIEILDPDFGDQIEGDDLVLEGFSYDAKVDTLYVYTDSIDHAIAFPKEVITHEEDHAVLSMLVKDSEGRSQIVNFEDPVDFKKRTSV